MTYFAKVPPGGAREVVLILDGRYRHNANRGNVSRASGSARRARATTQARDIHAAARIGHHQDVRQGNTTLINGHSSSALSDWRIPPDIRTRNIRERFRLDQRLEWLSCTTRRSRRWRCRPSSLYETVKTRIGTSSLWRFPGRNPPGVTALPFRLGKCTSRFPVFWLCLRALAPRCLTDEDPNS